MSSLLFDTISAESQRLIDETYSASSSTSCPPWPGPSSTRCGASASVSECGGTVSDIDLSGLDDDQLSSNEPALLVPGYSRYGRTHAGCGFFDPDKPIGTFTKRKLDK